MTPDGWLAFLFDPIVWTLLALIVTEEQEIETGNHTDCDIQFGASQAIVLFADHAGYVQWEQYQAGGEREKRIMRSAERGRGQ